ncbi:hypothetical protein DE146DRAFT_756213 [Phaeosphaeria sp. MPI-PUGE-AT-0046c]|nr:hypothetical protein DE146DRAFT_756213 [Phaeosphaeria sp. MPI-PUGE-AT-0046c]
MRRETIAFFLAGTAWAVPTTSVVPRASGLDHYPQFCTDQLLRGKSENKVWTERDIGNTLAIFASMKNDYDKYINNGKARENKSFARYIAQILGLNFNWKCDANDCALEDGTEKCKKSESGGQIYLYLDSALAYWNYFDSFKKAIDHARDDIMGRLPSMWDQFGGPEDQGIHWTEAVGMMTAGASIAAGFLPGGGAAAAETGLGLIDTIAASFAPEENTEKKFDAYANTSLAFSDNVGILTGAINKYLKHQFEEPLDWDRKEEDQVNAVHKAVKNDAMSKAILTGEFAGLDTPKVDLNDLTIKAGLAAPLINAMWKNGKNYVVKFDRKLWEEAGVNICESDAFADLRAKDDNRIGCSDTDGSLYMIAHWGKTTNFDHTGYFRDVKGIDLLSDFGITRHDVIDGSIKNFDEGGLDYMPKQGEIFDRIKTAGNKDNLAKGLAQVWNLPYCTAIPVSPFKTDDLEHKLSSSAYYTCRDMKDKNGKKWPYKN